MQRLNAVVAAVAVGAAAAAVPQLPSLAGRIRAHLARGSGGDTIVTARAERPVGTPGAPATSPDGLRQRIADMESRLRAEPDDVAAAVALADALLRQARATNDGRPTNRAAEALQQVLRIHPSQYDALKMLGAIELSRHRFRDALALGKRARDLQPDDAWNYGVMGDALVELGEYDEAFAAFDRMVTLKPHAAAYARIAYARELRGDLDGALSVMRMAVSATSDHDVEARAWYTVQVAELLLAGGRIADANREYRRAAFLFPNYPHAIVGLGKVMIARGDRDGALETYVEQFRRTPTLDLAARIGDLEARRGRPADAERYYRLAEEIAGPEIAQTEAHLALFLAERDRRLPDAVRIAETVAATRHDIFTDDALAWSYYKAGRRADALAASQRAMRTGTHDPRVLAHAAAIRASVQ